ncbi:MAG: 7-carboxy-7-deazaguanine synthase QueE [Xanthomonadales bacterium]|nr:7-carboxy-7-deazaguanine synthase QueE [Xanthomonadales bacterium]
MITESPSPRVEQRAEQLKITEIFHSIQGEADAVGWPTVFVRLTGCPLRCTYCDTEYAFHGGRWMSFDEILEEVSGYATRRVCVTGGEPLAQKRCIELLKRLCDAGHEVSLETSGAVDLAPVDQRVRKVMDLKTPASGEVQRNRLENLALLGSGDQLKFVICNRDDFEWACRQLEERPPAEEVQVLFSPSYGELEPRLLAEWILADRIEVRLQLQVHKYLWGSEPGR